MFDWSNKGNSVTERTECYIRHEYEVVDISWSTSKTGPNEGFQPEFQTNSVFGAFTLSSVSGWTAPGSSKYSFSTPTLEVGGASSTSSGSLPDLIMTTRSFSELGSVADTRSIWQVMKDTLIAVGEIVADHVLSFIAWVADKVEGAYNWVLQNPLDAFQLALDAAGFIPVFGALFDLANAGIHAARGNKAEAIMSLVGAIPGYGDAAKALQISAKGVVKGAKAAKAAGAALVKKAGSLIGDAVKAADNARDAARAGNEAASVIAKNVDDVAKPKCDFDGSTCFVAGTKVLMRMDPDSDEDRENELLDALAASGTMTDESDESAATAMAALGIGIGLAVARETLNGKERRRQRPRRKNNSRRQTDEDVEETAMTNGEISEPAALVEAANADGDEVHTKHMAVPRRYLSGTLTALMLTCFAISGWLWLQPLMRPQEAQAVSVDAVRLPRENAPTRVTREVANIEDVQLGRRVVGRNPLREQTQLPSDIHPETHRTIRLEMIHYGTPYELAFVRSLTWLSEQQAQVGGMIQLVMTEMGLDGPARVISIEPCPEIEPDDGTGRMVVTGTMKHLAGNVLEIQTADDTEPLGVTDTHPFWSVDRQEFVVAGQLTVGESLEQVDGTVTQITRITPTRGPPVMVYNLEIDAEHVFHVGEDGLLVHNACAPVPTVTDPKLQNYVDNLYKGARGPNPIGTGSTADAVRNELLTGLPTHGRFHLKKALQTINGLTNWLRKNPNATHPDRLVAQSMLDDLVAALTGN